MPDGCGGHSHSTASRKVEFIVPNNQKEKFNWGKMPRQTSQSASRKYDQCQEGMHTPFNAETGMNAIKMSQVTRPLKRDDQHIQRCCMQAICGAVTWDRNGSVTITQIASATGGNVRAPEYTFMKGTSGVLTSPQRRDSQETSHEERGEGMSKPNSAPLIRRH